jgi:hypothetical protein
MQPPTEPVQEPPAMNADDMFAKAAEQALPRMSAVTMALCEQAMAKGLETAADTLRALADDITAGRAPVSDIREAADYLTRIATKKRTEAAKVLKRN